MKNIRHTFRAWLVCMLAMLAALPANADVTPDQLEFTAVEGGYSVTQKSGATLTGTLVIPDTYNGKPVVVIGERAFISCTALTSVNIPDAVTTIGDYAFSGCSSLASADIPDAVTAIGSAAFANCSGLTSVNIPDAVTVIGDYTFLGCSGLTSVTIGSSVTNIGTTAFYNCDLKEVICRAATPPTIYSRYSFSDSSYDNVTLYVPEKSVEAYRLDVDWSQFKHIVGSDMSGIGLIGTDTAEAGGVEIYGLDGVRHPEGIKKTAAGQLRGAPGRQKPENPRAVSALTELLPTPHGIKAAPLNGRGAAAFRFHAE